MKYSRPELDDFSEKFTGLVNKFKDSDSFEKSDEALNEINKLRNEFESMKIMAFINYSIDTNNKKYSDEQDYFDSNYPLFTNLIFQYYKALLSSKFKKELTGKYGDQIFKVAEITLKSLSPLIVEDMQNENHLCSEYLKLRASARIFFNGKDYNLQELEPFMESPDREERKKAFEVYWNFFNENSDNFDSIYHRLVLLRNDMAVKMGYKNFIELGYARMKRIDYNESMVSNFRKNIKKYIVPLATKLREMQMKRLGLKELMFYDTFIQFNSGNATPKGGPEWIMENGKTMYNELSNETKEFYDFMTENELMDVFSKKGKADMGYCEFIAKYKSPYIFANMNGTEGDITVLTHEAGHAFQAYASRDYVLKEYNEPSFETAEIHSMSMEFLTYPWMNLFFNNDTDKFKFSHLNGTINFLPYGVLVDDFQHWVYENPDASPQERNSKWRELEKEYMPHLNFRGIEFLEKGGRWQKQGHIYEAPFYYIDYCLAQICAFQFWSKAIHHGNGEFKNALKDYIDLCRKGGSRSFLQLVEEADLKSPFEDGIIEKLAIEIEDYIDSIDDAKF